MFYTTLFSIRDKKYTNSCILILPRGFEHRMCQRWFSEISITCCLRWTLRTCAVKWHSFIKQIFIMQICFRIAIRNILAIVFLIYQEGLNTECVRDDFLKFRSLVVYGGLCEAACQNDTVLCIYYQFVFESR